MAQPNNATFLYSVSFNLSLVVLFKMANVSTTDNPRFNLPPGVL